MGRRPAAAPSQGDVVHRPPGRWGRSRYPPGVVIRVLGATLALAVVLTGCSSKEKAPSVLPPVPSASPSLAPLSPPPEAAAETSEGASAFARYYMEVLGRATQTADAAQLRSLSDSGCGGCQNLIAAVEEARANGQRVREADFRVLFAVAPLVQGGDVIVDMRYERLAGQLVDDEGRVVSAITAERAVDSQMRLMRRNNGWVVLGFRTVEG